MATKKEIGKVWLDGKPYEVNQEPASDEVIIASLAFQIQHENFLNQQKELKEYVEKKDKAWVKIGKAKTEEELVDIKKEIALAQMQLSTVLEYYNLAFIELGKVSDTIIEYFIGEKVEVDIFGKITLISDIMKNNKYLLLNLSKAKKAEKTKTEE